LVLPTTGSFPVQWIVVTPRDHGSNSISFNGRERTIEVDDDDDSAELLLHPDFDTSKAPEDHR